jgi:tetratricopeptide (TPR) repeat protein
MTDHTSVSIPPPKDWPAFERNARLLFELSLKDPAVQNNGVSGQRQHGVDIFGRRGGGTGPQVGIQCKGKNADYGGRVTEKELRAEVEKTRKFVPPLDEFVLITTVPTDGKLQETVRLLEIEVRATGRALSIQVWGWDRVQQEIIRYAQAIQVFHPDATPFTNQIINEQQETRRLVEQKADAHTAAIAGLERQLSSIIQARLPTIASDTSSANDALDKELSTQIDGYRDDLLRAGKPRTALGFLMKLKGRVGDTASPRIRYRILSNIGAAHYNLGELDEAADWLLEAAPLNPNDPVSLANKIAALLIKGKKGEAHSVSVSAMALHPESQEIAHQRLQALGEGETVETIWSTLSETASKSPLAFLLRVWAFRELHDARWIEMAAEALGTFPEDEGIKVLHAESVVERFQKEDPGAVGLRTLAGPSQTELTAAAETLEKVWRDSVGKETPAKSACAHNGALAWSLLGETKRSAEMLDAAMVGGFDTNETRHNRIMLYRRNGQVAEAIRMADTLEDSPLSRIIRADMRIDTDPAAARNILSERENFTRERDIIAAALVFTETFIKEGRFDDAEHESSRLEVALAKHPQGPLAQFRVKTSRGDAAASAELDRALALVADSTEFPTRFLVAEALGSVQRYDDVVDILSGTTSTSVDSPALRALVGAAINSDRRVLARQLLDQLPEAVAGRLFYQKARVALEIRAGNIPAAETHIRAFLKVDAVNLELHLQLLLTLYRQDKVKELRTEAAKPAAIFKGAPEDFMKLAQFKDDFADWRDAQALGYKTLLDNPTSQSVAMGYVALLLRPGHSREMKVDPLNVAVGMAIELAQDNGAKPVFIIELDAKLRTTSQHIAPDHRVAQILMGKARDDAIEMPDGSLATITSIKPKELYALHDILENFPNRFPEMEGLERVNVEFEKEGGLEPMLARLRDRHDAIQQVNKLYEAGTMPLALAARAVGRDPVETLVGIAASGVPIRSCEGSHLERVSAFAAINANAAKGCIVDVATLHIIRRLNLEKAVLAVCGPIGVVEGTVLHYQHRARELSERIDEPDMSLSYRDGQYYRTEVSPEEKRKALALAEEDRTWLSENTSVVPAEGKVDPSASWRPLIERFGTSFLDELRAAQGSGHLLLCEDLLLRQIAFLDFRVPGAWLQPVLMQALSLKAITEDEYRNAIVQLIESGLEFISISTDLLVSSLHGANGLALPAPFIKLASRLGGKKADLPSHVHVALNTIIRIWEDETLSWTLRQAVLGHLLERLIANRSPGEVTDIMATFVQRDAWRGTKQSVSTYVMDWLQGHFIVLQPAAPSPRAKKKRR